MPRACHRVPWRECLGVKTLVDLAAGVDAIGLLVAFMYGVPMVLMTIGWVIDRIAERVK